MLTLLRRLPALLVLVGLLCSSAHRAAAQYAASPLTQLSMHSDAGDVIGQGQDYLFNANDGTFTPTVQTNSAGKIVTVTVQFSQGDGGEQWDAVFSSKQLGRELTPGVYALAKRFPFEGSGHPGLDVSGDGRGSNTLTGTFTVTEAVYDYSSSPAALVSFAATFEQHSEGATPALTGTLYYNSYNHPQVPDTSHPDTTAVATGSIGKYGRFSGPVQVSLSATDPDGVSDVAGTYYLLDGGARQTYAAPFTISVDGMHSVRYYSVDRAGNQESPKIRLVWIDRSPATTAPAQTRLIMHSQAGDAIGLGQDYLYTDSDGQFGATAATSQFAGQTGPVVSGISAYFTSSAHGWTLDFSTVHLGTPMTVDTYENAMLASATADGHPGLAVSGDGRGNDTLTGTFTVLDLVLDYSASATQPQIVSFAATFEQHSDEATPALFGTFYYRSTAYAGTPVMVTFASLLGGQTVGTVTLATPAPAGGETVALASANPGVASVPASVTVPAGALSASFPVTTAAVTTLTNVEISASANGVTSVGTLAVPVLSHHWTAVGIAAGPGGVLNLLWDNANGSTSFWNISGSAITYSPTYGPYAGWTAAAIAAAPNGSRRILWTNTDGTASVWTIATNGAVTYSPLYGPSAGASAVGITVSADGLTHLLWTNTDGTAVYWTIAANGTVTYSPTFGPFAGWTARSLSATGDGGMRLLWTNTDGRAGLWKIAATGSVDYGPTYGPFAGWTAIAVGVGTDNVTHLLWDNTDGSASYWNIDTNGAAVYSPTYGPF